MKIRKATAFLLALAAAASAMTMPVAAADIFGDIDADGDVDAADAAWILQYAAYTGAGGKLDLQGFVNGEDEPEQPGEVNGEDVLTIVAADVETMSCMAQLYQEEYPDANIRIINPYDDDAGTADLPTMIESGEDIDLYVTDAYDALYCLNRDTMSIPLSELGLTEADYANAYPYALEMGKNSDGELRGAGWDIAPGGYCYNTEIAKEYLGITTPVEMQEAVSSWDQFMETAEKLKTAANGDITMTASLYGVRYAYASENTQPWVINDLLCTEKVESFYTFAKELADHGYVDNSVKAWTPEWYETGKNGSTMGYFFPSWIVAEDSILANEISNAGNWAVVTGPQEFYWGGSMFCAAPQCNTKEEAARFLKFCTVNADSMQKIAESTGTMVNNQVAMQNIIESGSHSNSALGGQNEYEVLHEVAKGIDYTAENAFEHAVSLDEITIRVLQDNPEMTVSELVEEFKKTALEELGIQSEAE